MGCGQGSPGRCSGGFKPGAQALSNYIKQKFPGVNSIGGYVCRTIAGSSALSDHAGGRALDIMTTDHALGSAIAQWLIDMHHSGCVGVAYICWWNDYWNCKVGHWAGSDRCNPRGAHKNHVHLSMFEETAQNWSAACATGGGSGISIGSPGDIDFSDLYIGSGGGGGSSVGGIGVTGDYTSPAASAGSSTSNPTQPKRPPNTIIPAVGAPDPLPVESTAEKAAPRPPAPPTAPQVCGINAPPPILSVVSFSASAITGMLPLDVEFADQTQYATAWAWDLDGNGSTDAGVKNVIYRYNNPGTYKVGLTVANTDSSASGFQDIIVTEPPPPTPPPPPPPPLPPDTPPAQNPGYPADVNSGTSGDTGTGAGPTVPQGRALCHSEHKNAVMVSDLIRRYFPAGEWDHACRVAWCESNFNPRNVGREYGEQGLFQVYPKVWRSTWQKLGFTDMFDPDQNVRMARYIYNSSHGGSWKPWTCAKKMGFA